MPHKRGTVRTRHAQGRLRLMVTQQIRPLVPQQTLWLRSVRLHPCALFPYIRCSYCISSSRLRFSRAHALTNSRFPLHVIEYVPSIWRITRRWPSAHREAESATADRRRGHSSLQLPSNRYKDAIQSVRDPVYKCRRGTLSGPKILLSTRHVSHTSTRVSRSPYMFYGLVLILFSREKIFKRRQALGIGILIESTDTALSIAVDFYCTAQAIDGIVRTTTQELPTEYGPCLWAVRALFCWMYTVLVFNADIPRKLVAGRLRRMDESGKTPGFVVREHISTPQEYDHPAGLAPSHTVLLAAVSSQRDIIVRCPD